MKPIKYSDMPFEFNETKHYVIQAEPVDMGDYLFVELILRDLVVEEYTEPVMVEPIIQPTLEEKVAAHDIKIVTLEETIDVIYGGRHGQGKIG